MTIDREVQRLTEVYRNYRESGIAGLKWSLANPGNRMMAEERQRMLTRLLQAYGFLPLAGRRILDIGCGGGAILASFKDFGASPENLFGIDLMAERIVQAKESFPGINFQVENAEELAYQSAYFDLVLLFTVFSSILDYRMAHNVANEIIRVLKPGGAVVWYDFRYYNPSNPHVKGMTRADISALFPGLHLELKTLTLLPPLARRLGFFTPVLYPVLSAIRFLHTHYLGILTK